MIASDFPTFRKEGVGGPVHRLSEGALPSGVRRWNRKAIEWLEAKRQRRKFEGKGGEDALRLLTRIQYLAIHRQ